MVKWEAFIFGSIDLFVKNFACSNKILHTCMGHVCGVWGGGGGGGGACVRCVPPPPPPNKTHQLVLCASLSEYNYVSSL